jgi:hypothetical protein
MAPETGLLPDVLAGGRRLRLRLRARGARGGRLGLRCLTPAPRRRRRRRLSEHQRDVEREDCNGNADELPIHHVDSRAAPTLPVRERWRCYLDEDVSSSIQESFHCATSAVAGADQGLGEAD